MHPTTRWEDYLRHILPRVSRLKRPHRRYALANIHCQDPRGPPVTVGRVPCIAHSPHATGFVGPYDIASHRQGEAESRWLFERERASAGNGGNTSGNRSEREKTGEPAKGTVRHNGPRCSNPSPLAHKHVSKIDLLSPSRRSGWDIYRLELVASRHCEFIMAGSHIGRDRGQE